MRSLRIAHLGSKGIPSKGGTERVVEAVARRQAADGHQVTVYGSSLVCGSAYLDGVRVLAMPALAHKYLGPVLLQLACAADVLWRGRYDVLHLHGAENAFVLPLLRLRYPVVTTNHGPAYLREKWSRPARAAIRAVDGLSVRLASRATAVSVVQARGAEPALRPRGGRRAQRRRARRGGRRGGRGAPARRASAWRRARTCCSRRRASIRPRAATRSSKPSAGSRTRRRSSSSATCTTRPATRSGCGRSPRACP